MGKFRDLTGQRFGRLKVCEFSHIYKHMSYWKCVCDCGKTHTVCGACLTAGRIKSCGCLHAEKSKERATKHGQAHTKLYYVWQSMIKRCEKEKDPSYVNYGARGISVCPEWHDYKIFYTWANNNGYEVGKSIDRINNDDNYCPQNCRWATRIQQNNNTRRTIKIKYCGKTKTLTEWVNLLGLNRNTIYARLYCHGWTIKKALTTKIGG